MSGAGEYLGAWDEFPVHQSAAVASTVAPASPGWSERFYFNLMRPTGEIVAVVGGGIYPGRGLSECYFCRLEGDRQVNVRSWQPLAPPGPSVITGSITLRCDTPLRDWTVTVEQPGDALAGRFTMTVPPYLYDTIDIPASEPDGGFDRFRHFVATGRWSLDALDGVADLDGMLGVRDRTWGVRTRRPRLHTWCVLALGDRCLALKHQELADGTVLVSEAGLTEADGRVHPLRIAEHDLVFDPEQRLVSRGRVELASEHGSSSLELERVGLGLRLAGAGYDAGQGARGTVDGSQRDEYDLADPEVAVSTGRGTIDAGIRARLTGALEGEGTGVFESAVARDHVRYGSQIA